MKRKLQIGAALAAVITALAPVHALAEPVVPRVYKIIVQGEEYLYNKKNDLWYDMKGHLLEKTQESTQRARWGDDYYTVDLDAEKVYDESGAECERLTKVLNYYYDTLCPMWINQAYYFDPQAYFIAGEGYRGDYFALNDLLSFDSENAPFSVSFDDSLNTFDCGLYWGNVLLVPMNYPVSPDAPYQDDDYQYECTVAWQRSSNGIDGSAFTIDGDLNLNGEVDVVDAVLLARLAAGDSELKLSDLGTALADYNGDGKQGDAADLTRLIRRLALLDEPET